jgi:glutathione peroxidase
MTLLQTILARIFYPAHMTFSRLTGLGKAQKFNSGSKKPVVSFYELEATTLLGERVKFEKFRGKAVLIVNVASHCGYTAQYAELEKLYRDRKERNDLVVLGFPSNDFGKQEPGNDQEIKEFCRVNYQVDFPLFTKAPVSGPLKQSVYEWLSNPALNGWNDQQPTWNFSKYLIGADGELKAFFSPAVSPLSEEIVRNLG